MNGRHFKYSKRLHILTLLCFLLPFFNTSCEKEGDPTETITKLDTVSTKVDSANTVPGIAGKILSDTSIQNSKEDKPDLPSIRIAEKIPFLKPVLNPSEDVYSGLGTIIDSGSLIVFFSIPTAFLLLLVSLITKFIDKESVRVIVFIDFLSLIFLLIARSMSWDCERLWGFWTTVIIFSTLTIYDIFISRQFHRQEGNY